MDIVLLTLEDVEDKLLPAGNLREPISAVSEADVVVVREDEAIAVRSVLSDLQERGDGFAVWTDSPQLEPCRRGESCCRRCRSLSAGLRGRITLRRC